VSDACSASIHNKGFRVPNWQNAGIHEGVDRMWQVLYLTVHEVVVWMSHSSGNLPTGLVGSWTASNNERGVSELFKGPLHSTLRYPDIAHHLDTCVQFLIWPVEKQIRRRRHACMALKTTTFPSSRKILSRPDKVYDIVCFGRRGDQ